MTDLHRFLLERYGALPQPLDGRMGHPLEHAAVITASLGRVLSLFDELEADADPGMRATWAPRWIEALDNLAGIVRYQALTAAGLLQWAEPANDERDPRAHAHELLDGLDEVDLPEIEQTLAALHQCKCGCVA